MQNITSHGAASTPSRATIRRRARALPLALAAATLVTVTSQANASPGLPYNGRISFGEFYSETNGRSDLLGLSDDARYVAYTTSATNLTDEDTNTRVDCFWYDRLFGIQLLMSVATNGKAGNAQSVGAPPNSRMISPDGRYVLFSSFASDLIAGDTNGKADAFIRDTNGLGATQRVSLAAGGAQIGENSFALGMSLDAQKFLFVTKAGLAAADTNKVSDVYLYDRSAKTLVLVSSDSSGKAVGSGEAVIDESGKHVAFTTAGAINPADTNQLNDVYWKDVTTGLTKLASMSAASDAGNSSSEHPAISGDGIRVGFVSRATNLVSGDTNGAHDVFVKDVVTNAVFRASTKGDGGQVSAPGCERVSLSGTGHAASLSCRAGDLVSGDTNGQMDVFLKNLDTNAMTLISRIQGGALGNGDSGSPVISKDGTQAAFTSAASNLVPPDANAAADVMVGVLQ